MRFLEIISFIFCISMIISCFNKQNGEKAEILKDVIQENLGKKIAVPEELELYTPFSRYNADSLEIADANLKIYTQINGSCPTCVEGIDKWNKFTLELTQYKVPVVLFCTSKDDFELMKYLCEEGKIKKFPFPFFLDKKNAYIRKNSFMTASPQLETVLVDAEGTILMIGNPIHSEAVKKLYLNEIEKLTKTKSAAQ